MNKAPAYAILTSGGDAPGMNATIYGFVAELALNGIQAYVVHEGYQGLIDNQINPINLVDVKPYLNQAGSIIGSSRSLSYQNSLEMQKLAVNNLKQHNIAGLLVVGGDGSYQGAERLHDLDYPVVCAPGTIDNDVGSSTYTIGFFSAMQCIVDAVNAVRSTSSTHQQTMLVEVMGRHCADLALYAGMISGVDAIVTRQNPFSLADFAAVVAAAKKKNQREVIIIVSELTYGPKGGLDLPSLSEVAAWLEKNTNYRARTMTLGYTQRGYQPPAFEIYQGICFGKYAAQLLMNNMHGIAIGFNGASCYHTPLKVANQMKATNQTTTLAWVNQLVHLCK